MSTAVPVFPRSRGTRLLRFARNLVRWGIPPRSLLFGPLSLGDDLLCTAVLHEARRRGQPFAMMTARPELFAGNADLARLLPIDDDFAAGLRRLGARVVQPYYVGRDPHNADRDVLPPRHIIAEMCRRAGLRGPVRLRPWVFLTEAERARGALHPRQIAIHSSAAAAVVPFANKEWGAENLAAVARLLAPDFKLVQLGSARDPTLPVDSDLRGKTTPREAAAVVASSLVFVGLEGFLTHLARAVDTPAVVIFGGRVRPETAGYSCNANFFSAIACSPCGLRNTCDFAHACMTRIAPAAVAAAARELAARPAGPLPVATADLS
jgi:hypothetical protein